MDDALATARSAVTAGDYTRAVPWALVAIAERLDQVIALKTAESYTGGLVPPVVAPAPAGSGA